MSKKRNSRDIITSLQPYRYRPVAHYTGLPRVSYKTNTFALSLIEDRRTHYPGISPFKRPIAMVAAGKPARLKLVEKAHYTAPSQTKALVAFAEPNKLAICHRRQTRKEVLHAKGIAGTKKPQRKPRRNEWSDVSCKG